MFCRQDVFLMIRRQKTTIFTDAKESTTVYELKRIVEGILKRAPEDQRLYKVSQGAFSFSVVMTTQHLSGYRSNKHNLVCVQNVSGFCAKHQHKKVPYKVTFFVYVLLLEIADT